jgi:hypothetical protein
MTRLLFQQAQARIVVNGKTTQTFPILQGVRQGCPLAPYLFLVIGEILNFTMKREVQKRHIKGIQLPGALEEQVIAQFADDTSLSIYAAEAPVKATMETLNKFSTASRLIINEEKSATYHWEPGGGPRPTWTMAFRWQWATAGDVPKLL